MPEALDITPKTRTRSAIDESAPPMSSAQARARPREGCSISWASSVRKAAVLKANRGPERAQP
eukprot:314535-Pyramimonas_sp.AAC.1